jgi:MerR family transcriptional regulator, copper efflux regulator
MDIACTLSPTGLASRRERWERLIAAACVAREPTPDGVRLRFRAGPEAAAELRELAAAERDCCAWADWSVEQDAGETALLVRSTGDGVDALRAIFIRGSTPPS